MKKLNEFHPSLKFTYEYSRTKVNFLDVVVEIDAGQLISSPYFKSTDCHQYLHYESSHPAHFKTGGVRATIAKHCGSNFSLFVRKNMAM